MSENKNIEYIVSIKHQVSFFFVHDKWFNSTT